MKFDYDVLIVGGGPAGLQSAQMLGRAGRSALLCDDQRPRNKPAAHMHYFPTRDGIPPLEFLRLFRADLAHYPRLVIKDITVTAIIPAGHGFQGQLADGSKVHVRKIILADGVRDIVPPIPGAAELFGKTLFHCPYCHGYEFKGQSLGVMGNADLAFMMASLLRPLSQDLMLFTQGPASFSREQEVALKQQRIPIIEDMITEFRQDGELLIVSLASGRQMTRHGLLVRPAQEPKSELGIQLGCKRDDLGFFQVDKDGQSTVNSVFIAGDGMDFRQSVLTSTYTGMVAAVGANHQLAHEDLLGIPH